MVRLQTVHHKTPLFRYSKGMKDVGSPEPRRTGSNTFQAYFVFSSSPLSLSKKSRRHIAAGFFHPHLQKAPLCKRGGRGKPPLSKGRWLGEAETERLPPPGFLRTFGYVCKGGRPCPPLPASAEALKQNRHCEPARTLAWQSRGSSRRLKGSAPPQGPLL